MSGHHGGISHHTEKTQLQGSWYFQPSQPQRITPGLKQTSIRLLISYLLFTQVIRPQIPKQQQQKISSDTNLHM